MVESARGGRQRASGTRHRAGSTVDQFLQELNDRFGYSISVPAQPTAIWQSLFGTAAYLISVGIRVDDATLERFGLAPAIVRSYAQAVGNLNRMYERDANIGAGYEPGRPATENWHKPSAYIPTEVSHPGTRNPTARPWDFLFAADSMEDGLQMAREAGAQDEWLVEAVTPTPVAGSTTGVPVAGQGRVATNVLVMTPEGQELGIGVVWGIGEGGRLVVGIPGEDMQSVIERTALTDLTQGGEVNVVFGILTEGLSGGAQMVPDDMFTGGANAGGAPAVVFFKNDENFGDEVAQAIEDEGHATDPTILAAMEAEGTPYTPASDANAMLAAAEALGERYQGGTETYLGTGEPVRILYDQEGQRIRQVGTNEVVQLGLTRRPGRGQHGGHERGGPSRDPVSGLWLRGEPRVEDVEPHFQPKDVQAMLASFTPTELALFESEAIRNGLLAAVDAGAGRNSPAMLAAMSLAMAYSNDNGVYDGIAVTDEKNAIFLSVEGWGTNVRQPLQPYQEQIPRVLPSNEEIAFTVADYFEQRAGRKPTPGEMRELTQYLTNQYRLALDQADLWAENEYLLAASRGEQGQPNTFYLTPEQQQRLTQPLPREIFQIDPVSAFRMYFEEHYQPAIQFGERQEQALDFRESMLGSLRTLTGARNAL